MVVVKQSIPGNELSVPKIDIGIYKHYRGNLYEVIGVALHSETLEPMVVYKPLHKTEVSYWVRPYDMFINSVKIGDKVVKRFEKIKIKSRGY